MVFAPVCACQTVGVLEMFTPSPGRLLGSADRCSFENLSAAVFTKSSAMSVCRSLECARTSLKTFSDGMLLVPERAWLEDWLAEALSECGVDLPASKSYVTITTCSDIAAFCTGICRYSVSQCSFWP